MHCVFSIKFTTVDNVSCFCSNYCYTRHRVRNEVKRSDFESTFKKLSGANNKEKAKAWHEAKLCISSLPP